MVSKEDIKVLESVLHELVTTDGLHATDMANVIPEKIDIRLDHSEMIRDLERIISKFSNTGNELS